VAVCGGPAEVLGFRLVDSGGSFPVYYLLVPKDGHFRILPSYSVRWLRPLRSGRGLDDDTDWQGWRNEEWRHQISPLRINQSIDRSILLTSREYFFYWNYVLLTIHN